MKDLLGGLAAGGWGLFAGWIIPAAIATVLVAYGVLPDAPVSFAGDFAKLAPAEQAGVLALCAVAVGFTLNAMNTPLYRVLEGYSLPQWARDWRIGRHRDKRRKLVDRVREAEGVEYGLALERLHRYPALEEETAPTKLGNALRAFEVYGWDHFRLDSQTLWSELEAVAPESLRAELERARAPVDFCVSASYLSALVGLLALLVGVAQEPDGTRLLVGGAAALAAVPGWYGLAVVSTTHWSAAVQALVNLGRPSLAAALGLRLPATLAEERDLWKHVTSFVRRFYDERFAVPIDRYRLGATQGEAPAAKVGLCRDGRRTRFELHPSDGQVVAVGPERQSHAALLDGIGLPRSVARAVTSEEAEPSEGQDSTVLASPARAGGKGWLTTPRSVAGGFVSMLTCVSWERASGGEAAADSSIAPGRHGRR